MARLPAGSSRLTRPVALVGALLVAAACVIGSPGGQPDNPRQPATTAPQPNASEFESDINGAVTVAEQYWRAQFAAGGRPFEPIRQIVAYRREGEVSCGGQPLGLNNAAYCTVGDFIAYDVNWAARVFARIGDAFIFFLLGHEYAHGIQVRLGIQYQFTIQQELQADCMAGAYMGDSVRERALTLDGGDLEELERGLLAVGDDPGQPWFAPGAHGTAEQRTDSFFAGYERSLDACGLT
jgi:predicted metalloprotease